MMAIGAVLFLIGTINSFTTAIPLEPTEIIVEKHINPAFAEKLTNYGLQSGFPPFISNFMKHGTNIFFKPQFFMESKEDCKKLPALPAIPFAAQPQIVMDEPVKIVETIVTDNEPPVVDKVVVIKPSIPLAELPAHPMLISPLPEPAVNLPASPVVFSDTPILPPLPIIPAPVINTSENDIPAAPELPPLDIPQAPVVLDEPVKVPMVEVMQPAIHETPELPTLPLVETLVPSLPSTHVVPIPVAPELPPLDISQAPVVLDEPIKVPVVEIMQPAFPETSNLPSLPVVETLVPSLPPTHIVPIPAAPELPPLDLPQVPLVLDAPANVPMVEVIQPTVPETPELPPLHLHETLVPSLPPMPLLPAIYESEPEPKPAPYEEVYENHIPLNIPEAPKLPPYSPPPLPVPVVLPESFKDCDKMPVITSEIIKIPESPILPEPEAVILPSNPPTLIEEVVPVIIPQPPVLPSLAVNPTDIIVPQPAPESTVVEITPGKIPVAPALPEFDESKIPTLIENHFPEIIIMLAAPSVLPEVIVTPQEPTIIPEVKPAAPIVIPSPPELPPISMPNLPISVMVSEPKAPEVQLLDETQPILTGEPVLQSIKIPAPPVLPPMVPIELPEVTALPAMHDSPVIITESMPFEQEIISNEIPLADVPESILPVAIPQAPLLPPAVEIPLPVAIEEISGSNEKAKPVENPLILPPAPELPPLPFHSMPIQIEEPVMGLYPSAELMPVITEEPKLPQPGIFNTPLYMTFVEPPKSSIILSSPMAPASLPIVIPQEIDVANKIPSPLLSKIESIISFPTTCVKNIVIERVLPNIVREGIEVVSSPSLNYPVLSSSSSTIGIRLF